jgi:hypothetical protein
MSSNWTRLSIGFNRYQNNLMVSKIPRIMFKFWCTERSAET